MFNWVYDAAEILWSRMQDILDNMATLPGPGVRILIDYTSFDKKFSTNYDISKVNWFTNYRYSEFSFIPFFPRPLFT